MLDFEKHLESLNNEPEWFKNERVCAWERFSQLPSPVQSDEAWRVLNVEAIDLDKVEIADAGKKTGGASPRPYAGAPTNIDELDQIKQYIEDPAGIIIESTHGTWCQLSEELSRQGVICTAMPEALTKHAYLIQSFSIGLAENIQHDKFAQLNQAFCHGGIFIYVPDSVVISKPLVCLNLFEAEVGKLAMSRLTVPAGRNSQLSIVNILSSGRRQDPDYSNKSYALVNYLMQMHMQAGAQLDYAEVQNFSDNTFVIKSTNYGLERDSRLQALTATLGAGQLKDEIRTVLQDRGAECTVNGIVLGNKSECFNVNTIDDHNAPDTKSSIDFRFALKDEAKSIYHGTIKVAKEAQKTNAFQSNKNLLLGDKAHADSIPKLEILTDDVKCSHGATVGPVDHKQLFYLMSRGLNASQAEELIVNGFFHQLVGDCKIKGVSDWLDVLVANKIEKGTVVVHSNLPAEQKPVAAALRTSHKKEQPALVK